MIKRGRKEAMEVDQVQVVMVVHMYMGFVKCHTNEKWFSKEPLMGLANFILTQVFWTNDRSVPRARGELRLI